MTNKTTLEFLENRIFVEMNSYYQEVSFNKTRITGIILKYWVDIPKNMSYYGNYSDNDHSLGARKLIEDAIRLVDYAVDFSIYKFVMVVHVGDDEALSRNETDIWSWGWWGGLGLTTNDGVVFQQGAVVSEINQLGMFCHEYGHILGLPDLYNYDKNATTDFVGPWDLMGKGNWNDNGTHPSHPVAWSKIKLGWIDPSQIATTNDRNRVVRVEPLERSKTDTLVVKIPIVPPNVYYLVEVRMHVLYDNYLPSEGVLVTLVNETRASGQGIVRVMDAMSWSKSLDDAAFRIDGNAVFLEAGNDLSIVVLKEVGNSFVIHITSHLNGIIAKEAQDAILLAEKQIDVLKDSKIVFLFFTISRINLSKALEALGQAKIEFQNQKYIQSIRSANQATFQAEASTLELLSVERNIYFWFSFFTSIVMASVITLFFVRRKAQIQRARMTLNTHTFLNN